MRKKSLFVLILSLVMCISMMPITAIEVLAVSDAEVLQQDNEIPASEETPEVSRAELMEDSADAVSGGTSEISKAELLEDNVTAVPYTYYTVDEADETKAVKHTDGSCENYTTVTSSTTSFDNGKWYVASENVYIGSRITVNGEANLILCDGVKLDTEYGITVNAGNTLNIYAQSEGTGTFSSGNGIFNGACIGGLSGQSCGTINIHGGVIKAISDRSGGGIGSGSNGIGGSINIFDGDITAEGDNGNYAGIGGGDGGRVDSITIYGGTVNAKQPGINAAAIGGGNGCDSGDITINGGTVTTDSCSVGIGSGDNGNAGNITINGGTVSAIGSNYGAGIGGGRYGNGGNVTINGGNVTASGYRGVGAGQNGTDGTLALGENVTFKAGADKNNIWVSGDNDNVSEAFGKKYFESTDVLVPVEYVYYTADGNTAVKHEDGSCPDYKKVKSTTTAFEDGKWYIVKKDVELGDRLTVAGTANLILLDGVTLTASKGINVSKNNTLNIYGQSEGSGSLVAQTGDEAGVAAIGGNYNNDGGTINIHGGTVSATGTDQGAGIGGGAESNGGSLTIFDGKVSVGGGENSAAIGGGQRGDGGTVIIYGGTVKADNSGAACGIGGGKDGEAGNIIINGGTVNATGGLNGASAIGGNSGGGSVTINGGTVTAAASDGWSYAINFCTLTLGDGVGFGAGNDVDSISVLGDQDNVSEALGKKYFESPHIHVFDKEVAEENYLISEATCTKAAEYYKSCKCGLASETETFTDGEPNGHKYGDASYEWSGDECTAERICTVCEEGTSGHIQTEKVTGEYVKDTDADCTNAEKGHYVALFTNEAFETQQTAKDSVSRGKPIGHKYSVSYKWSDNQCTAERICTVCEDIQTETVTGTYVKDTDADCTNAEKGHYVASFTNEAFETQQTAEGSVSCGEPIGHKYGEASYEWSGDECTAERNCTVCKEGISGHSQTETVTGEYVKDTDADCTNAEKGHYVASFTNEAFEMQQTAKDSVSRGEALGHAWNDGEVIKAATRTENGVKKYTCTACSVTKDITICAAKTVELSRTTYTYNGKQKNPKVTVNDSKGNAIPASNYTITKPSGRTKVGKYTYTIKFRGDYAGSKSLSMKVNPPKTSIKSLSRGRKSFKVKWTGKTTQVTGYQIQYSTKSSFSKKKTVTVKSRKTTTRTVKKLKAKKKYYVRVRTYKTVKGTKYYSAWSTKKTVKTK